MQQHTVNHNLVVQNQCFCLKQIIHNLKICVQLIYFRLRDLGLQQFDTVELFAQILLPAAFLLACILQLHYFNCDFLTLTDLKNVPVCDGTST